MTNSTKVPPASIARMTLNASPLQNAPAWERRRQCIITGTSTIVVTCTRNSVKTVARLGSQTRCAGRGGNFHAQVRHSGCHGSHKSASCECRGHDVQVSVLLNNSQAEHTSSTRNTLSYKLLQSLIQRPTYLQRSCEFMRTS